MENTDFKSEAQLRVMNEEKLVELLEKDFGISTLPTQLKNDKKKMREVYLKLIDNGGDDSFIYDIYDTTLKEAPKANINKKETLAQKRKRLKKELFVLFNVTIHDNNPTETLENDEHVRVRFVSWGNDVVGHYTTKVIMDHPVFVHEGALRNLRAVTYRKTSTKKGESGIRYSKPLPRYTITYNEVTQEFIDNLAKKQALEEIND